MIRVLSFLVLMATPAVAASPRPVTPADVVAPMCFGFAPSDSALYAVRTKSTCDDALKCEVASYLTRVTKSGVGKTVGYLALARKDGEMPTDDDARKSANPGSLAKANEAMADATVPCGIAKVGDTLQLANGRTVKVLPASQGTVILRSDNFQDIELAIPHEQLFWGPDVHTWFMRRATAVGNGQDTEFISFDVSSLFGPLPRPASPQAIALTTANALSPQCLGAHKASGRYWFSQSTVAPNHVHFQLIEVGPAGTTMYDVARKPRVAMAPDPKLAASALTAKELAFANARLAEIDAPCSVVVPPLVDAPPLTLGAKIDGAAIELSTVAGNRGKQLRFKGPLGARRHVLVDRPVIVHSANGSKTLVVQSIGASSSFEAVDLSPLSAEPRRFELPQTLPACVRLGQLHIVVFEQTPERAALVLRNVLHPEPSRVLAEGPPNTSVESLRAQLTPERLVDLAEVLPPAKPSDCSLTPIGPEGEVELALLEGPWRLGYRPEGERFTAKVVTENDTTELRVGEFRVRLRTAPQWVLKGLSRPQLVTMDGGRFASQAIDNWEWRPQPIEDALKAPKLLEWSTPAPMPIDRRCLAWSSKDRSAWIVRWQETCDGYECRSMAVLTEVRSDGYYQRVTLNKDGSDWSHMFGHANTMIQKADVGCTAGRELGSVGRLVKVSSDGTHVIVEVDRKAKKMTRLSDSESLVTAFSHPQVGAIAIEIKGDEGTRYLWVDISKFK